jgi:hypothetical protein
MKSLLIAMLVLAPLYAFAQDAKMPAEAKKVIDKYEASVEVARKAFDAAVAKARDQALKDLKPIQTAETKKGNLDGAMLVKSKVDELTSEIPKPAAEGDLAKPVPPSTDPRVTLLLGKWKVGVVGGPFLANREFRENGVIAKSDNSTGKYLIEKDKVIVTWPYGVIDTFRLPLKNGVLEGSSSNGIQMRLEKIEENK